MNKKIFTVAFFMTAMLALPLAADNDDNQSESSDNSSNDTADNSSSSEDADSKEVAQAIVSAAMERGVYY